MRFDPTDLPNDWSTRTIGECCDILDSRRVPVNEDERFYRKGAIPYYGANGQQGWIDDFLFDEELVLIAEDGGLFDEYSTRPIAYRISGKSWVNNHAHILRAKNETTNSWVFYNLVHADIRYYISGGTRAKLTQNELKRIVVPFTKKPEQNRIIEVLETVDDAISKTKTVIDKLRSVHAGLLHDLLTRGLDVHGQPRDPIAHPEQFQESPIGQIPLDWDASPLGKFIGRIDQGWSPDCDSENTPAGQWGVLKTTAVQWEGYDDTENKRLPSSLSPMPICEVKNGDVLMTRCGPGARVGVVALVSNTQGRLMLSDKLYRLVPRDSVNPAYLVLMLSSHPVQSRLAAEKTGMAESQTNISHGIVRKLNVAIPILEEQDRIVVRMEIQAEQLRAEIREFAKLQAVRSGLMTDLLTGRMRVMKSVGTTA
jgi:type I restriction enzyme S subunit